MALREARAALLFVLVSLLGGTAYRAITEPEKPTFTERLRGLEEESRLDAERAAGAPSTEPRDPDSSAAGRATRRAAPGRPDAGEPALGSFDPERAGVREWERLPGIGPALAARIVADREARGPFGGPDGLARVRGIGQRTVERIRPFFVPAPVDSVSPNAN